MFEQSILGKGRSERPLSFVASISAELVVVSVLILIPLAYNDHLPDFHWRNVTVGAPLKSIEPRPAPAPALRRASNSFSYPRVFSEPRNYRFSDSSGPIFSPEAGDAPSIETGFESASPRSSAIVDIPQSVIAALPPAVHEPAPAPRAGPLRVSAGVQMAKIVKKIMPEYPALAKSARVSGVVHLVGIIARGWDHPEFAAGERSSALGAGCAGSGPAMGLPANLAQRRAGRSDCTDRGELHFGCSVSKL